MADEEGLESSESEDSENEDESDEESVEYSLRPPPLPSYPPAKPQETQIVIDDPLELELSDDLYEELGFLQEEVVESSSTSSDCEFEVPLVDIQPVKKRRLCLISPPTVRQTVTLI